MDQTEYMKRTARFFLRALFPKNKYFLLLSLLLVGWVVIAPVFTQGQGVNTYTQQYDPGVPRDENTALQVKLVNVLSALACQITGTNPAYPNRPCVGVDSLTGKISFLPKSTQEQGIGGAIGFTNTMIATMYTVPAASTHDYIAYLGDNFGIVKSAHAQGVGFTSLSPILPLWTTSRNIAYLFYIIAFVLISILIMIRVRIDPRTVMTIQNQIPKIVVGIILITFSYAIAGFLIDFMYVTTYTLTNIIVSTDPQLAGTDFGGRMINQSNPMSAADLVGDPNDDFHLGLHGIGSFAWKTADGVGDAVANLFNNLPGALLSSAIAAILITLVSTTVSGGAGAVGTIIGVVVTGLGVATALFTGGASLGVVGILTALGGGAALGGTIGKAVGTVTTLTAAGALGLTDPEKIVGGVAQFLAFIIIGVAILSSLFRLWFSMMKAYILILIIIIMAPFYILFGLIPGSSLTFGNWVRALLANLSIFPVVIVMFLMARVIINGMGATQDGNLFVPPMVGNASVAGAIQSIVGLTFILLTPSVVEIMRAIFHSKTSPYTANIGAAGAVGAGYLAGTFKNYFGIRHQMEEFRIADKTGKWEQVGFGRALSKRLIGG